MEKRRIKQRIRVLNDKLDELSLLECTKEFKLSDEDKEYIRNTDRTSLRYEIRTLLRRRIGNNIIFYDGEQTPCDGDPISVAQHATCSCCRKCLNRYHGILEGTLLRDYEISYFCDLIVMWIDRQMEE